MTSSMLIIGQIARRAFAWFVECRNAVAALAATLTLLAGYTFAFATTLDQPVILSLGYAAINTIGAAVAGLAFYPLLSRFVLRTTAAALLHPPLATAFALLWYFCTLVGFSVTPSWVSDGLSAKPFGPVAFSWQMFQGVTLYAVLALFVYWREAARQLDEFRAETAAPAQQVSQGKRSAQEAPGSLLIRCEKEVVPLSMNEIVRITGTDGYAEVFTTTKRILSTTSLARFEDILPGDQFIRAHRSHIVRLGAVRNAEPAGNGKLVLNLADGQSITTSRTGAKRLRELAV